MSVVQTNNAIELTGKELYACGVVIGNLVVMKDQQCAGTSPGRILAVASDEGIRDLTLLESAGASGSCKLGNLARVQGSN